MDPTIDDFESVQEISVALPLNYYTKIVCTCPQLLPFPEKESFQDSENIITIWKYVTTIKSIGDSNFDSNLFLDFMKGIIISNLNANRNQLKLKKVDKLKPIKKGMPFDNLVSFGFIFHPW